MLKYILFFICFILFTDIVLSQDKNNNYFISMVNSYLENRNNQSIIEVKNDSFNIVIGKIFSIQKEHAYIKFINPLNLNIEINIFRVENNRINASPFKIFHIDNLEFVNDSLIDINNDNVREVLIHTYPNSGCCLRNREIIYFYNVQEDSFNDSLLFMNPFFLEHALVIGLSYGHLGETHLYKGVIKNNMFELQQVIEPIIEMPDKYYLNNYYLNRKSNKEIISKIPELYSKLPPNYLSWFYGNLND